MSLLDRYKKPGGFLQLLALMETCGQAKREKFLAMILEENVVWHDGLKQRILSLEKLLGWPPEVLSEITSRSLPITLAAVSKGLDEAQVKTFFTGLSHSHLSKIREISENKNFTQAEVASSIEKFIGEARTQIQQGVIKLDKFAPELVTQDGMEDLLAKTLLMMPVVMPGADSTKEKNPTPKATPKSTPNAAPAPKDLPLTSDEVALLRKQVFNLQQELQAVRHENATMKEKLERIRKIA